MKKTRNYAAFYALLKKMPGADKEELVRQYTDGRTAHLSEMSSTEYWTMIQALNRHLSPEKEDIKTYRSGVLHLMQRLGVDTSQWDTVDRFCENSRIAGKRFAALSVNELNMLAKKLRAIERKKKLDAAIRRIDVSKLPQA